MKVLFSTAIVLLAFTYALSQETVASFVISGAPEVAENFSVDRDGAAAELPSASRPTAAPDSALLGNRFRRTTAGSADRGATAKCCSAFRDGEPADDKSGIPDVIGPEEKFHWKPAMAQSMAFLAFQHTFRIAAQEKTRRELGGPFFRDWGRSVGNLRGWRDGDNFVTNYIGHPMQGAFTGRIFVNNSDNAKKQEFGPSKEYWRSRARTFVWSAAWSAQFELGPFSEATIGNVGINKVNGHSTMAYVDLVVTPMVGTAVLVGEDAIDKYFLKNWLEKKSDNKFKIKLLRSLVTPTTSISNLVRWKVPWKRDERPL